MAQFYKRFVKNFAAIAKPLTDLTRTTKEFRWNDEAQEVVQILKMKLCKLPEMFLPDVRLPFILRTDASNFAIGAVLSQIRNDEKVPVTYFSRKLHGNQGHKTPDEKIVTKPTGEVAYPVHEQELLAIHDALVKWRHYLLRNEFTIYTDHHPFKFFMNQKRLSPRQARWAEFLQQFNLHINYTPGKSNVVPDALSRRVDYVDHGKINSVAVELDDIAFSFNQELQGVYEKNSELPVEIQQLQEGQQFEKGKERWKKKNSMIWKWVEKGKGWRIWMPKEMVEQVVWHIHTSPVVACGGVNKMLEYISRYFTWKGISQDVKRVIAGCDCCAQNKATNTTLKGMLQPLPIPEQKWTHLSMDFITDLPEAISGENAIYVVVDRLTKQAHFIPCQTTISARGTADLFLKEVWRLHGFPQSIVSDRDPRFISSFWQALTEQLKI